MVNIWTDDIVNMPDDQFEALQPYFDQALLEGEVRWNCILGRDAIDFELIRSVNCLTKSCMEKVVSAHVARNQEILDNTIAEALKIAFNHPKAEETAIHKFYEALFHDLLLAFDAFGTATEYKLCQSLASDYAVQYTDWGQEFQDDPFGFVVEGTLEPIITVGGQIVGGVIEASAPAIQTVGESTAKAIFGDNWKRNAIIALIGIIVIVVLVFAGYHFVKTYASAKAQKLVKR